MAGEGLVAAVKAFEEGRGSHDKPKQPVVQADAAENLQVLDALPAASTEDESASDQGTDQPQDTPAADDQDPGQDGDEQPEGDTGAEQQFTVQVDGKPQQVAQSELIAGYQRNADYIRKSQEVAEGRKEVEKLRTETSTTRDQLTKELGVLRGVLAGMMPTSEQMDKMLAEGRTADYLQAQRQWQSFKVITDRQDGLKQHAQAETTEQRQAREAQEVEKLVAQVPELADVGKRTELGKMLLDDGFTADELKANPPGHREMKLIWEAAQYRKLKAQGLKARKQVEGGPKLARPTARQNAEAPQKQQVREVREALARNGSVPEGMRGTLGMQYIKT